MTALRIAAGFGRSLRRSMPSLLWPTRALMSFLPSRLPAPTTGTPWRNAARLLPNPPLVTNDVDVGEQVVVVDEVLDDDVRLREARAKLLRAGPRGGRHDDVLASP